MVTTVLLDDIIGEVDVMSAVHKKMDCRMLVYDGVEVVDRSAIVLVFVEIMLFVCEK